MGVTVKTPFQPLDLYSSMGIHVQCQVPRMLAFFLFECLPHSSRRIKPGFPRCRRCRAKRLWKTTQKAPNTETGPPICIRTSNELYQVTSPVSACTHPYVKMSDRTQQHLHDQINEDTKILHEQTKLRLGLARENATTPTVKLLLEQCR